MIMRIVVLYFVFSAGLVQAQKALPLDSVSVREVQDFFVDDYGSIYLYKNTDFSLTKYDSLGNLQGRLMMTVPFRVQSVQNPLSLFLFSQNTQELRLLDQNLNEIQTVRFNGLGFIQAAYTEDLQQVWLLDALSGKLLQYNYRNRQIIASYPINTDLSSIMAIMVYQGKLYGLTRNGLIVYDLKGQNPEQISVKHPVKLRRENDFIYVICRDSILKLSGNGVMNAVFEDSDARIVDKNSFSFFEVKGNKFYLYDRNLSGEK